MVSDKTIRRIINENQNLFIALEELDRTGRLVKTRRKEKVNFTIDEEVMRKLRAYSDEKRINMSRIVEDLIKNLVEEKKELEIRQEYKNKLNRIIKGKHLSREEF